jgi:hypothetical protein
MGGGGAPTAKFPTVGSRISGRITAKPTVEQQRDIKSGEKKFWSDGNPMMQLVVTVQTDQRDPQIEEDDGKRRVFVKGQLKQVLADAVRSSGARGLEVGGTLTVIYTGDGLASGPGMNPPKQYRAEYTSAAQTELLGSQPAEGQAVGTLAGTVNTTTGEITAPVPAAAGDGALDPNDPKVQALLAQLKGGSGTPAAAGGTPPF